MYVYCLYVGKKEQAVRKGGTACSKASIRQFEGDELAAP